MLTNYCFFFFFFLSGSVFCCNIEPKEGKLVVSGGEDDAAYVWNIADGQVVFKCENHTDSVTSALFSHDGSYLATADMGGLIQVWKIATKSVIWSFETGDLTVRFCVFVLCINLAYFKLFFAF